MNILRSIFLIMAMIILCGCEGLQLFERLPNTKKYTTEDHLLKDKVKEGGEGYFEEYEDSFSNPTDSSRAEKYILRGINLNRTLCFEYLDRLASYNNHKSFIREGWLATTVLATGLLAIERGTSKDIQRVALGSTFGLTMADQFANHYLLGPDGDAVVELIHKALGSAEAKIRSGMATNFDGAYMQLHDYANICTSSSIRRIVRDVLQQAKLEVTLRQVESQISTNDLKAKIEEQLNVRSVSDVQLAILYWATHGGVDQNYEDYLKQEIGKIGSIDEHTFMNNSAEFKSVKEIFSDQSPGLRTQLNNQINKLKRIAETAIADKKIELKIQTLSNDALKNVVNESLSSSISDVVQPVTSLGGLRVEAK